MMLKTAYCTTIKPLFTTTCVSIRRPSSSGRGCTSFWNHLVCFQVFNTASKSRHSCLVSDKMSTRREQVLKYCAPCLLFNGSFSKSIAFVPTTELRSGLADQSHVSKLFPWWMMINSPSLGFWILSVLEVQIHYCHVSLGNKVCVKFNRMIISPIRKWNKHFIWFLFGNRHSGVLILSYRQS